MQRGVDTAAEWSDVMAEKLNAAADPRAKLLRKRRWALRLGVFFAVSCVFWVGVTGLLSAWDTPFWALFIPAPIAVGAGFLATLSFLRYRWLLPPMAAGGAAVLALGIGGGFVERLILGFPLQDPATKLRLAAYQNALAGAG